MSPNDCTLLSFFQHSFYLHNSLNIHIHFQTLTLASWHTGLLPIAQDFHSFVP